MNKYVFDKHHKNHQKIQTVTYNAIKIAKLQQNLTSTSYILNNYKLMVIIALVLLLTLALTQNPGNQTQQYHLPINWLNCTSIGNCNTVQGSLVISENWRWVHNSSSMSCYTGSWNCGTAAQCTANCYLEGISQASWSSTYGISSINCGNGVQMKFVTPSTVGGRIYMLANTANDSNYQTFKLLNKQFAFDVDMSTMQCGMNGALYFVQMQADAGMSKYSTNKAGPAFGTGYCDSTCPKGNLFVNGQANLNNAYGACCSQLDLWQANKYANVYTVHPCTTTGNVACTGSTCNSQCQTGGCGINSYRNGNKTFYGPSTGNLKYTLDTSKNFTVVTQFITTNNKDTGLLKQIKRYYIQNGIKYQQPSAVLPVLPKFNNLNDTNCKIQNKKFGESSDGLAALGGLAQLGRSMANGMVLVFSLWDDPSTNMHWLDSIYPENADTSYPGVVKGPCPTTGGKPSDIEKLYPNSYVQFNNIKVGPIGSTY